MTSADRVEMQTDYQTDVLQAQAAAADAKLAAAEEQSELMRERMEQSGAYAEPLKNVVKSTRKRSRRHMLVL